MAAEEAEEAEEAAEAAEEEAEGEPWRLSMPAAEAAAERARMVRNFIFVVVLGVMGGR